MAVLATSQWRIRTGGNELNGGGFDSTISGAGTDYTDQDAAQLSLTDITTSGASANISSATGGFTSAMIGNCLRLASGTNATAGYYFITAVANTNDATVDRTCSSGSMSGGTGRVGGAWVSLVNASTGGSGPSPLVSSPIVAGNVIHLRGAGTENPSSVDYDWDSGYWTFANGTSPLPITLKGYNGRPLIGHQGLLIFAATHWHLKSLCCKRTASGFDTYGFSSDQSSAADDCYFDSAGYDSILTQGTIRRCFLTNTGSTSAGSNEACKITLGSLVADCRISLVRGAGVKLDNAYGGQSVSDSLIHQCGGDGVVYSDASVSGTAIIDGCTIDNNGGHGINVATNKILVRRCLITNHTASGKKGFNYSGAAAASTALAVMDSNFYGNTTNSSNTLDSSNTTLNPSYVGSGDYTPTNTSLLVSFGVGSSTTTTSYRYLGAVQPNATGGGGSVAIPVARAI